MTGFIKITGEYFDELWQILTFLLICFVMEIDKNENGMKMKMKTHKCLVGNLVSAHVFRVLFHPSFFIAVKTSANPINCRSSILFIVESLCFIISEKEGCFLFFE